MWLFFLVKAEWQKLTLTAVKIPDRWFNVFKHAELPLDSVYFYLRSTQHV